MIQVPIFPRARCRTGDPETWFPAPSETDRILAARRACGPCPHAEQCYLWARDTGSVGVWGGIPLGPGMDLMAGGRLRSTSAPLTFAEAEAVADDADAARIAAQIGVA